MKRSEAMKRTLMAIAAAATLAVSTLAAPAPAHAQRGVAAGVAAGLLGGAIVGGAIASQNGYYGSGDFCPRDGVRGAALLHRMMAITARAIMVQGTVTAVRPMSPIPVMAVAICSDSGSGTATAGG